LHNPRKVSKIQGGKIYKWGTGKVTPAQKQYRRKQYKS
jgi:hypothetical protein